MKVIKCSAPASSPRGAGHLIRHRRSKLGRRKLFGDTKSKSKLIRHKDVVRASYQEGSRSERVKRAATARPERIWDYAVIPYEIDSNFRSVLLTLITTSTNHFSVKLRSLLFTI